MMRPKEKIDGRHEEIIALIKKSHNILILSFLFLLFSSIGEAVTPWHFPQQRFKIGLSEKISGKGIYNSESSIMVVGQGAEASVPYIKQTTIKGNVESQKMITVKSDPEKGVITTEQPYLLEPPPEPPAEPCASSQPEPESPDFAGSASEHAPTSQNTIAGTEPSNPGMGTTHSAQIDSTSFSEPAGSPNSDASAPGNTASHDQHSSGDSTDFQKSGQSPTEHDDYIEVPSDEADDFYI